MTLSGRLGRSLASANLPFTGLYSLCLLLAGNFLAFDLLRRLSGGFEPDGALTLLLNFSVIWLPVCCGALMAAGLLWFADRLKTGLSQVLLLFLLYTINITFTKYRLTDWFDPLPASSRAAVCAIALLSFLPFALMAQRSLTILRNAVVSGGIKLALQLSMPVLGVAMSVILHGPDPKPPSSATARQGRPDILLLTIDTLAAADMSLYGYSRPTTPEIDALARDWVVFERAHSPSNLTSTSLCGYEGFYAASRVAEDTLLNQLRKANYRDNLFVSFNIPEFFGLLRPDKVRVVTAYEDSPSYQALSGLLPESQLAWLSLLANEEWHYVVPYDWRVGVEYHRYRQHEPSSEEKILQIAADHLRSERKNPTFVWAHLWQPHYPYLPGPEFLGRFESQPLPYPPMTSTPYTPGYQSQVETMRRRYDEYILGLDATLGRFFSQLRTAGVLQNTIIIIGSDHGESFQSGWVGHSGPKVSEPLVHIPLLLNFPGEQVGRRVKSFVSPVDLAPTLLRKLGLDPPKTLPGEDLQPYLTDPQALSPRPKMSISNWAYSKGKGEVAVYSDRFKVVFSRENPDDARVYDLLSDPTEQTNLREKFGSAVDAVVRSVRWPETTSLKP